MRLQNYDHSELGVYFITICTQDKEYLFGKIIENKFYPNKFGLIVQKYLEDISNHNHEIELDESIIMPNHIYTIILIVGRFTNRPKKIPFKIIQLLG